MWEVSSGFKMSSEKMFIRITRCANINIRVERGSVPEWLMGADCKSAGYAYASSNLARPIFHHQSLEYD